MTRVGKRRHDRRIQPDLVGAGREVGDEIGARRPGRGLEDEGVLPFVQLRSAACGDDVVVRQSDIVTLRAASQKQRSHNAAGTE